jgi:hypothetical protein
MKAGDKVKLIGMSDFVEDLTMNKIYSVVVGPGGKDIACGGKVLYNGFIIFDDVNEARYCSLDGTFSQWKKVE